ncbi:MAG: hypothetical protein AAB560_00230 [Patescibacteria group bacterium]
MILAPLLKIILIIAGSTIIVGGIAGYIAFKYKSPKVEVEISGAPTGQVNEMKMDIPGATGEKIGDITWTANSSKSGLPAPFNSLISVFEPSIVGGITNLQEPPATVVAFITDEPSEKVKEFYLNLYNEKLSKNGWKMENLGKVYETVSVITIKFKKIADFQENIVISIIRSKSTNKTTFTITYTKAARD